MGRSAPFYGLARLRDHRYHCERLRDEKMLLSDLTSDGICASGAVSFTWQPWCGRLTRR